MTDKEEGGGSAGKKEAGEGGGGGGGGGLVGWEWGGDSIHLLSPGTRGAYF